MVKISPSVLACDLSRLSDEVKTVEGYADMLHLDVMDGSFVTNISFGLPVIKSLRDKTDMIFDVHLMIDKPERYAARFLDAGADILTFHIEACEKIEETLSLIRNRGKKAALSVKPTTPIESVYPYLEMCDMILVMTVEPGYGGQALIPHTLDKVRELRGYIEGKGLSIDIQVDGGINLDNARSAIEAGANILVAGSAVFNAKDRAAAIKLLKS